MISTVAQSWVLKFRNLLGLLLGLMGLFPLTPSSYGFALLGPFAPWMEETNGLRQPGDIGGPMDIGSGYRWNVPIVTYGFDRSFLDYFGTNGVAAVEAAIQILDDLPSASDIVLTNYPLKSTFFNNQFQAAFVYDLKSATLVSLLEQMGLTQPTRYVFALRHWDPIFSSPAYQNEMNWPEGTIPNNIVQRNFDPETLSPSTYVNGTLCAGIITWFRNYPPEGEQINMVVVFPADPSAYFDTAVADNNINNNLLDALDYGGVLLPGGLFSGGGFTGLTKDDVGGLRYLLSADNVNYEKLLPDVHAFGPKASKIGNGAWRPGVEKITLVRQPFDQRKQYFRPLRYDFTDFYLRNNVLRQQPAERIVREPDLLFCAADTGENKSYTPMVVRSSTTNWLNNATLNGNTNGEGPGVIRPPVKITFHKLGPRIYTEDNTPPETYNLCWGSFDDSTTLPISYPSGTYSGRNRLVIHLRFYDTTSPGGTNISWSLRVPLGGLASLEISTNQIDWDSLATATNSGSVIEWRHYGTDSPPKFFRVIPQ